MDTNAPGAPMSRVREFVEYWIENSVHAAEGYGGRGGSQSAAYLAESRIEMAGTQGISIAQIELEVGDLSEFIESRLQNANLFEGSRTDRDRNK